MRGLEERKISQGLSAYGILECCYLWMDLITYNSFCVLWHGYGADKELSCHRISEYHGPPRL